MRLASKFPDESKTSAVRPLTWRVVVGEYGAPEQRPGLAGTNVVDLDCALPVMKTPWALKLEEVSEHDTVMVVVLVDAITGASESDNEISNVEATNRILFICMNKNHLQFR